MLYPVIWITFGILLLVAACPGHLCTDPQGEQIFDDDFQLKDELEANEISEEIPEETLESILGSDWVKQNQPASDDEIKQFLKYFWNLTNGEGLEPSIPSSSEPNPESLLGLESENSQYMNKDFVDKDDTNKGEYDYDPDFTSRILSDNMYDVSSDSPNDDGTSNPSSINSSIKPENEADPLDYTDDSQDSITTAKPNIKTESIFNRNNLFYKTDNHKRIDPNGFNFRPEYDPRPHYNIPQNWFGRHFNGVIGPNTKKSNIAPENSIIPRLWPHYDVTRPTNPDFGNGYYPFNSRVWPFGQDGYNPQDSGFRTENPRIVNQMLFSNPQINIYPIVWFGDQGYTGSSSSNLKPDSVPPWAPSYRNSGRDYSYSQNYYGQRDDRQNPETRLEYDFQDFLNYNYNGWAPPGQQHDNTLTY